MSTTLFGQKLRLNVVALISEVTVGKMLVCVDEDIYVEDLSSKIRGVLVKSQIEGRLLRLLNAHGANLPGDEKVGDVLRDAEEVVAVLVHEPADAANRRQLNAGAAQVMNFSRQDAGGPVEHIVEAAPMATVGVDMNRDGHADVLVTGVDRNRDGIPDALQKVPASDDMKMVLRAPAQAPSKLPGPSEAFEEDLLEKPASKGGTPTMWDPSNTDWNVEGLSPKLREYICTRFKEAHLSVADNGKSFISVSMRPRARAGASVHGQPIHYSIARIDVIEFERLCAEKVQETRSCIDHFHRCREALIGLLNKGAAEHEYAPNMLPYRYRRGEEFSELLSEIELPTFAQVEGHRPTILIDNSGGVGESLVFVREAMKRMLYSFIVAKSKFNLLSFSDKGEAFAWANGMVPPTAQVLREAEEWLSGLRSVRPSRPANFLEGVHLALGHPEADVVYILTSGLPRRCGLDYALRTLRSVNVREVPIHIIGVDCDSKAQLDLRRLAEDNHGCFRHKRFDRAHAGRPSPLSTMPVEITATLGAGDNDDARLTIGGQLSILDVMIEEQESHKVDWLEEQKCANRLLLTTATQCPVPTADQALELHKRAAVRERELSQSFRLQELLEASPAAKLQQGRGGLAPLASSLPERRAGSALRASSQPRAGAADALRRPSTVNPWDRPGSAVRPSMNVSKPGVGKLPRPGSAHRGSSRGPSGRGSARRSLSQRSLHSAR